MKFKYKEEERTVCGKKHYEVNLTAMHGDDEYEDTTNITFTNIAHVYCLTQLINSELAEEELEIDNVIAFEEVMREIFATVPREDLDEHACMWAEYFKTVHELYIEYGHILSFDFSKVKEVGFGIEDILETVQSYDSIYDQSLFYSVDSIVYYDGTGKESYISDITAEA